MSDKHHQIEEGLELSLDFTKLEKAVQCGENLIPAVAQDVDTKEILILGYANRQAFEHAVQNKVATFWSTSRNELWVKGATSGDILELVETRVNCDQNSILYLVKLKGKGACHTKDAKGESRLGCYYRKLVGENQLAFIERA